MTNKNILVVRQLNKKFGAYKAVDNVELTVSSNEIYGFLGPNGAGKTTTIKMLAGLLRPDSGTISIAGFNLATNAESCKQLTGYIPDRPYLYEKLTGIEFLQFFASLYKLKDDNFNHMVDRLFTLFDLSDWRDHLIESYSHGMRQKLMITAAFMIQPPLIIVDEPMVGLDPKSAKIVKELFKEHADNGGAVFLSTHSLEVAEELCDQIAIIKNGRIRATGDMRTLQQEAQTARADLEDIFLQLTSPHELNDVKDKV